jgi:hypothetical protein
MEMNSMSMSDNQIYDVETIRPTEPISPTKGEAVFIMMRKKT